MSAHEKAEPKTSKTGEPDTGVNRLNEQATEALAAIAALHDKAMTALVEIAAPAEEPATARKSEKD
jgi:hypothetical protein